MSAFDILRPKWKHSDPEIRALAVAQLTNHGLLATIAETDPSPVVRVAATGALSDRIVLTHLATNAECPRVRETAVINLDDDAALRRIAACDTDPWVRLRAKMKVSGLMNMRDHVKNSLARLRITTPPSADKTEFSGSIDEVCRSLVEDRRFCINGRLEESEEAAARASSVAAKPGNARSSPQAEGSVPAWNSVNFLAAKRTTPGQPSEGAPQVICYQIKIWKVGTDTFNACLEERRIAMANDVAAWGRSSNGADVTPDP